jgi:hypothetical protein
MSARAAAEDIVERKELNQLAVAIQRSTRQFNQLWVLVDRETAARLIVEHQLWVTWCGELGGYFDGTTNEKPIPPMDEPVRRIAQEALG